MEHKSIDGVAVKAGKAGTAEVIIATIGEVDLDGDVVAPGAIGSQTVPILPAHNWSSIPLGKARTREVGNRVLADLHFNLDVPEARSWHSALMFDVEHGPAVQEYSWGYKATKSSPSVVGGRRVRLLERVRLHEVSMVVQGASVGSGTVGVKCADCEARDGFDSPELRRVLADAKRHIDAYNADLNAELVRIRDNLMLTIEQDRYQGSIIESRHRAKGLHFYTACNHPDPTISRAGMACLEMCAAEFGIEPPALSWMVPESPKERAYFEQWGFRDWPYLPADEPLLGAYEVHTGRVWVRAGLSFEKTMEIVAHEVCHAAGGDEKAARAYQADWAARLPADERSR